jgi:two-component system LytT family response regulator
MIRCIIVDDEQPAIDVLVNHVGQSPMLQLEATFTNPIEALHYLSDKEIQLVFLDVQMPELSGIDFIQALNGKCNVIMTTAYSEFALKGYDLNVVDYLVKPIRFARFLQAVQKAADRISEKKDSPAITPEEDHIFVKTGTKGELQRLNFEEIDYIEAMKNYIAFASGTKKTLVYASMKEIEDHLPKSRFIRVHKSFIIPVKKITGIKGNTILLKDVTAEILIGDSYKAELMQLINGRTINH